MAVWKALNIDNDTFNSLEGLAGIEECTNYDENFFAGLKCNVLNNRILKKRKRKHKFKQHSDVGNFEEKHSKKLPDLSPSRQGSTIREHVSPKQNAENELQMDEVRSWTNLPLHNSLLMALANLKFTQPTAIQSLTLPAAILGKRDIVGAAETGSGKTLAFCLPILYGVLKCKEGVRVPNEASSKNLEYGNNLYEQNNDVTELTRKNPVSVHQKPLYALILTPTRELAIQVKDHLDNLAKYTDISTALIIGGMAIEKQLRILSKGPEIVVSTPGRLWEILEEGNKHLAQLNHIRFLAIDETDRMLEKGHFQELVKILEKINAIDSKKPKRQTFVFSATLTLIHELPKHVLMKKKIKFNRKISNMTAAQKLKKIIETLNITNPKVVDITDEKGTPLTLMECKITCDIKQKDYYVYYFLMKHPGKTLIFCNSIGCVQRLTKILSLLNCNALALHSSLQQRQRLKHLDKFKESEHSVLIATDVAARGLDISCIQHVIHYQIPRTSESYVHRSGRTARVSKEGITVLLVEPNELSQYLRLCRTLQRTEDFPLFPVEQDIFATLKERINLARELDKLELNVRKTNSDVGWLQKAAAEMDIIIDDDMHSRSGTSESHKYKAAAERKRKQLNTLLQQPILPRCSKKFVVNSINSHLSFTLDQTTSNAIDVLKNVLRTKNVKRTLKTKHLFKSKIAKASP